MGWAPFPWGTMLSPRSQCQVADGHGRACWGEGLSPAAESSFSQAPRLVPDHFSSPRGYVAGTHPDGNTSVLSRRCHPLGHTRPPSKLQGLKRSFISVIVSITPRTEGTPKKLLPT